VTTISVRGPTGPAVLYRFDKEAIALGRSPDSDIVIVDPGISRFHAEIRREGQRWTITDRGSQNGTLVNGRPVVGTEPLSSGDEITLGDAVACFNAAPGDSVPEALANETVGRGWSLRGTGAREGEPVMVGESDALREALVAADRAAAEDVTILVTGESGTGKELLARRIHARSPRARGPFVVVNCPALPASLIEAELFGVQKGTATGVEARAGRFEMAHGGTIFLDEIGDLELAAQAKLLRVLQDRIIERVGGREPMVVDARAVAATNHDLVADIERGAFRRDLYHRIHAAVVHLPPLRERGEDLRLLVAHFLSRWPVKVSPEALDILMHYDFPGNVRELEHVIQSARIFARGPTILPEHLPEEIRRGAPREGVSAEALYDRIARDKESFWDVIQKPFLRREVSREEIRRFVRRAYREAGGSYRAMARHLGIDKDYKRLLHFLWDHDLGVDS